MSAEQAGALLLVVKERDKLLAAIREHRDQKGDDRCHLDDGRLYASAGLEPADVNLPPRESFLRSCALFYDRRAEAGERPTYAELAEQLGKMAELLGCDEATDTPCGVCPPCRCSDLACRALGIIVSKRR